MSSLRMNIPYRIFMYYFLFHRASNIILLYDPCRIKGNDICIAGRFCCSGCKHLSDTGCTTKSLGCRVGLCGHARMPGGEAPKKLSDATRMRYCIFGSSVAIRENCADMIKAIRYLRRHKLSPNGGM